MNQLRHFLSRGTLMSRCALVLVFTVLMLRVLLSSVVMLDADAPIGSFGLVMCSGHGAMFPTSGDNASATRMPMDSGMQMVMPGMAMTSMSGAAQPPHSSSPMGDQSDPNSLCPFSAAFLAAITVAAVFSLVVFLMLVGRSWTPRQIIAFIAISPYCRPRTRAPPFLM